MTYFEAQSQNYQSLYKEALLAYEKGDNSAFLDNIQLANNYRPNHQAIMYQLATAFALNEELDSACHYLTKVIEIDAINYDISTKALVKLQASSCYGNIKRRKDFLNTAYLIADTALLVKDPSLHIEGIAFDQKKRMFLVSSINKRNIFWVKPSGELLAVLKSPLPVSPTGMALDAEANLWVASMGIVEGGLDEKNKHLDKAFLYQIDLETGSIVETYEVGDDKAHLFGDVFMSEEQDIYVSDSKQNEVYILENEELKPLLKTKELLSLQGITKIGHHLILADYVKGLFSFDLSTGKLNEINNKLGVSLKGVDGLYSEDDYLIAVQNGVQPNRIIKLYLKDDLTEVASYEFLEKNHPSFGEPTLGYVNNHYFYFIANSFWQRNNLGEFENLEEDLPVILKLDLGNQVESKSITTRESVTVIDGHFHEALYYYLHNWAAFRDHAQKRGYLTSYAINTTQSKPELLVLETSYQDSLQRLAVEEHFKNWSLNRNGPRLLNELKPDEFRKSDGFVVQNTILNSIENNERVAAACEDEQHRAFDFWLGGWEVYDPQGTYLGHNSINRVEGGCGLQEHWTSASAGFTGSSYNFYDSSSGHWNQTWIDNQGGVLQLSGGINDGQMQMQSTPKKEANGVATVNRITWTSNNPNEVIQIWEVSTDSGVSWSKVFHGIYKK